MIHGLQKRWQITPTHPDVESLAKSLDIHPIVAQTLLQRGIGDEDKAKQFFKPSLKQLHDPALLPGVNKAAERIVQALRDQQTIAIYGDYDVDGVTATAILFHMLKTAAPDAKVLRYIPHRIDEGYGLNSKAIETLAQAGAQLIISVDCGITAIEPAETAKKCNVDLIITDHHELALPLPDAFVLVHPRLHEVDESIDEPYPYGELCGAGVAYKLAWQIARLWCGSDRVSDVFRVALVDLLSLAALGTVADVVPLVDENRIIVHFGLGRIKHTPYVGLNALIDASRLRNEKIDSYHCGFTIGPRLNACGRLGHAKDACQLLTDPTTSQANKIAEFLNTLNEKRRATEQKIIQQATELVIQKQYDHNDVRVIVLHDTNWHPGVIGIVCSRLVERFGRPAILLNSAEEIATGSARSIDGFNLFEALKACDTHLVSFGGHGMAAGLKCKRDDIDAFQKEISDYALNHIELDQLTPLLTLDGVTTLSAMSVAVVEQIEKLQPFGRDNPAPQYMVEKVTIAQQPMPLGREAKHIALVVKQGQTQMRCVGWNMGDLLGKLSAGVQLDLAAKPKINRWAGRQNVELELKDLKIR